MARASSSSVTSYWHFSFMKVLGEGWGLVVSRRGVPGPRYRGSSPSPFSFVYEVAFLTGTENAADSAAFIERGAIWLNVGATWGGSLWSP